MLFTTPARLLKIVIKTRELERGANGQLSLQRGVALRHLRNRNLMPTETQYEAAAKFLTGCTGLDISVSYTRDLLSLFPLTRIRLAEHGLSCKFGVDSYLKDAAGYFFLGCRWPIYRDKVDMNTFLEVLRKQGEKMGLTRVLKTPTNMTPEERRTRFTLVTSRADS